MTVRASKIFYYTFILTSLANLVKSAEFDTNSTTITLPETVERKDSNLKYNQSDSDSSPNDDATNIVMDEKTPSQISKGVKTIVPYPHVDDQNMSVISNATEVNSTAWNLYHNGTDPECPNSKANGTSHGVVIWIWTSIIILILIMIALILMLVIMVRRKVPQEENDNLSVKYNVSEM